MVAPFPFCRYGFSVACLLELTFDIAPDPGGGYGAQCREADLFTEGETLDEVRANVIEAVQSHFFDAPGEYGVRFELADERVRVPA